MSIYYRFEPIINISASCVGLLPRPVLALTYRLSMWSNGYIGNFIRYIVMKKLCKRLGRNVYFGANVEIRNPENLSIGDNVSINLGCYIDAVGAVSIGDDVSIAHGCSILSFNHGYSDDTLPIRKNPIIVEPIQICSDVWIGAGVRVLAGSIVGSRSIVAAGAVVTKRIGEAGRGVFAGVPIRLIKRI